MAAQNLWKFVKWFRLSENNGRYFKIHGRLFKIENVYIRI